MTRYSLGLEQIKKQRHWQAHVKAQERSGLSLDELAAHRRLEYGSAA